MPERPAGAVPGPAVVIIALGVALVRLGVGKGNRKGKDWENGSARRGERVGRIGKKGEVKGRLERNWGMYHQNGPDHCKF